MYLYIYVHIYVHVHTCVCNYMCVCASMPKKGQVENFLCVKTVWISVAVFFDLLLVLKGVACDNTFLLLSVVYVCPL